MPKDKEPGTVLISLDSAMAGILALLVDERERLLAGDKDSVKTEVLLSRSGMSIDDIARVTGKKYDAVRMAIRRGSS